MPKPRYNSKMTAKKQKKQQIKMAKGKYDEENFNASLERVSKNIELVNIIRRIEEKTKPFVSLTEAMKAQNRVLGEASTRCAYILYLFWDITKRMLIHKCFDVEEYDSLLKCVECILLVVKHKYKHKNHVADTLAQNYIHDKIIAPCGSDLAFTEYRWVMSARSPTTNDVEAFITIRKCENPDVFRKAYKVDFTPALVEYALTNKDSRRKGAFRSLMINMTCDLLNQGESGDIVLLVEDGNAPMLNAIRNMGGKKVFDSDNGGGAMYHVNLKTKFRPA